MIDLSGQIRRSIDEQLAKAQKAEEAGHAADAGRAYDAVHRLYLQYADRAPSEAMVLARKKQALRYREMARRLASGEPSAAPASRPSTGASAGAERSGAGGGDPENDKLHGAVSNLIVHSPITWDQIGGLEATKAEIKFALALSLARKPPGVEVSGWRNMLFYGPPGTGKTLLAAATSNALATGDGTRSCFFNVKVSSVLSKYFGESTKLISALYAAARDASPSVVFLDEFESLTASRGEGDSGAERRILSTILAELDGMAEKGRPDIYVMTIAATNRPWEIDAAVLSRFEKKVLIPLPDDTSRGRILEILLTKRGFTLEVALTDVVALTRGWSGRELEALAKEVTGKMIAEVNADLVSKFEAGTQAAREYQLKVRPLRLADFERAAAGIVPQTRADEMMRYGEWGRGVDE